MTDLERLAPMYNWSESERVAAVGGLERLAPMYDWSAHTGGRSAGDSALVSQRQEPDGNGPPAHRQNVSALDVLPQRDIHGLSALDTPDGRDGRGDGL